MMYEVGESTKRSVFIHKEKWNKKKTMKFLSIYGSKCLVII